MKKEHIYKILYIIGILLIITFSIAISLDYFNYDTYNNSAPFYVFVIIRIFELLIPSIIFVIIGKVLKNRYNKSN